MAVNLRTPQLRQIGNAMRALEQHIVGHTREYMDQRHAAGEFYYIPLVLDRFFQMLDAGLLALGERNHCTWVDVGCGIGTKVILAQTCYTWSGITLTAKGIEKDPRYVEIARKTTLEACGRDAIVEADALTHDYSPYDLIYFYRPLIDDLKQTALEKQIIETCKPGTVITPIGNTGHDHWHALKQVSNAPLVFQKTRRQ